MNGRGRASRPRPFMPDARPPEPAGSPDRGGSGSLYRAGPASVL